MGVRNQTQVAAFVFMGFSGIPDGQIYLFLQFLIIYLVTVLGNLMIFTLIQLDPSLHSPMYYFLSHLSCLDIFLSSVTVPKILVNFLREQQTITYHQCLAQMFFLIAFTGTETTMLAVMAYDRYAAICRPLHYSHLMNTKLCAILAFATWLWGFTDSILHSTLSSKLYFCGANQIYNIYCDLPPLMKISCSDAHVNEMVVHLASLLVGGGPFFSIILSYVFILSTILKLRSTTGKCKAFSTCASYIIVVVVYFGNGLLNYNHPSAGHSLEIDTLVSTMFCIIPPMLNPLIYSLRNKDMKGALRKVLESQGKPKHHPAIHYGKQEMLCVPLRATD